MLDGTATSCARFWPQKNVPLKRMDRGAMRRQTGERFRGGFLLVSIFWMVGCAPDEATPDAQYHVRAPVLEWCEEGVIVALRSLPERLEQLTSDEFPVDAQYIPFDISLRGHPSLAGFVELTSSSWDEAQLLPFVRAFTSVCEPNMEYQLSLPDENDVQHLVQIHEAMRDGSNSHDFGDGQMLRFDPGSVFVVVGEDDYISLFLKADASGE